MRVIFYQNQAEVLTAHCAVPIVGSIYQFENLVDNPTKQWKIINVIHIITDEIEYVKAYIKPVESDYFQDDYFQVFMDNNRKLIQDYRDGVDSIIPHTNTGGI